MDLIDAHVIIDMLVPRLFSRKISLYPALGTFNPFEADNTFWPLISEEVSAVATRVEV